MDLQVQGENLEPTNEPESYQNEYENQLNNLLVSFMRETNLPFETIEHPRLQEIIRHLNPNVTLPTFDKVTIVPKEEPTATEVCEKVTANVIPKRRYPLDLHEIPSLTDLPKVLKTHKNICIVCLKICPDYSKVKTLTLNEASFFLLFCVLEKVHSMQSAQSIYAKHAFRACRSHFTPIYEAGLKHLGVENFDDMIKIPDETIKEMFGIVREIRVLRYKKTPDYEATGCFGRLLGSFRLSLHCFFKNYIFSMKYAYTQKITQEIKANEIREESISYDEKVGAIQNRSTFNRVSVEEDFPEDFLE